VRLVLVTTVLYFDPCQPTHETIATTRLHTNSGRKNGISQIFTRNT